MGVNCLIYGAVGDYLAVDATGTALEWVTPAGAGVGRVTMLYNLIGAKAVAAAATTEVYGEVTPAVFPGTNY